MARRDAPDAPAEKTPGREVDLGKHQYIHSGQLYGPGRVKVEDGDVANDLEKAHQANVMRRAARHQQITAHHDALGRVLANPKTPEAPAAEPVPPAGGEGE